MERNNKGKKMWCGGLVCEWQEARGKRQEEEACLTRCKFEGKD